MKEILTSLLYKIVVWSISTLIKIDKSITRLLLKTGHFKEYCDFVLEKAKLSINGKNPWDIRVNNDEFYINFFIEQQLGLSKSYANGHWDCDDLGFFINRICMSKYMCMILGSYKQIFYNYLLVKVYQIQSRRVTENVENIFDFGNQFLDPNLQAYSFGYWKNAQNLHQSQIDKLQLIAQKLKLTPGMRVLEIGTENSPLSKYLSENYNVEIVTCPSSGTEVKLATNLHGSFDRIVFLGTLADLNYSEFFKTIYKCMAFDGIFLCQAIGVDYSKLPMTEPWFHETILPTGFLVSKMDIHEYAKDFKIEDTLNLSSDYCKTLMAWHENLVNNRQVVIEKGEKFFRTWKYNLLLGASGFRSRKYEAVIIVLSKNG